MKTLAMKAHILMLQQREVLAAKGRAARSERGATAVEYGLLIALIAVVIIGAVIFLGNTLKNTFNESASSIAG
jgi:pilus assembly protein Flp/PilA